VIVIRANIFSKSTERGLIKYFSFVKINMGKILKMSEIPFLRFGKK